MTSALSKRQQARNEKALQELVQSVPGNNFCADCSARNPAWASWSLGVFLCVRCASIHRKLGTHISKVKSLSMDSWSNEQVENMRKVGNATSNKIYNPQNKKPSIPIDVDEVDSAMERFIRAKYMQRNLNGTKKYGVVSRESEEGSPPPLPPKTGKFGSLRSASSIFPLGSKAKKAAALRDLTNGRESPRSPSPRLTNKPSKVFGASVEYDADDTEKKLARLRDMGFTDNSRNAVVLKGVNGSIERAIEALVRLGEGDRRSPSSLISPRESSLRATRSLTPVLPTSNGRDQTTTPSTMSSSPWDLPPAQPQTAQSTGTLQNKNPYFPSATNSLGSPAQNDPITQAFQNMSLAPAQPLFPNHTGGVPTHSNQPVYYQPGSPAPVASPVSFNSNQTYPQPQMQMQMQQQAFAVQQPQPVHQPMQGMGYNPFFTDQAQQQQQQQQLLQHQQASPQQTLSVNTMSVPPYGNNPFTRSPTRIQSPTLGQIPEQSPAPGYVTSPQSATNPFLAQMGQTPAPTPVSAVGQHPFQSMNPMPSGQPIMQAQQPPRADKASILALYNYPQLAPQPQVSMGQDQQAAPTPADPNPASPNSQQPRSLPTPVSGSKNPFYTGAGAASPPTTAPAVGSTDVFRNGGGHVSRDSVQLGMDMASWANGGRHSPDAFASLSARHG